MSWPLRKLPSRGRQARTAKSLRQQVLRSRLLETVRSAARVLIEGHDLERERTEQIWRSVSQIERGIDLVLLEGRDAYEQGVEETCRGGAIIAQSADAFSHAASTIGDVTVEQIIGSTNDTSSVGHIFYQLGFERDGSLRKTDSE